MNRSESNHDFPDPYRRRQPAPKDLGAQRGLLEIVWAGKWVVLAAVLVGLTASIAYLKVAEPRFTSSARFLVEKNTPAVLPGGESNFATASENYLNTHAAILRADPVIHSAVERGGLDALESAKRAGSAFRFLKSNLESEVGAGDDIMAVRVEALSPEDSRQMVESVVEAYLAYQGGEIHESARRRVEILTARLGELRGEAEVREAALLAFQAEHAETALNDDRGSAVLRHLGHLNDRLVQQELEVRENGQRYQHAVELLSDTSDIHLWRDRLAALVLGSQLTAMEGSTYQRLLDDINAHNVEPGRFGENHPSRRNAVQAQRSLRAVLSERERVAADTFLAHLIQQKQASEARLRDLRDALAEQKLVVLDYQDKANALKKLTAAVEQTRADILVCEQGLRESESVVAKPQNIRLLEQPVAGKKTHPKPAKNLVVIGVGLGFVFGSLLTLPLGLLEDRRQASLRTMHEHGIPSVGTVPPIPDAASKLSNLSDLNSLVDVIEAYRMVRTSLDFVHHEQGARSFLITSPAAGDGKTTTSVGLALTMARKDRPVLVVDADLRRGVLHERLKVENRLGLSDVLKGEASIKEAVVPTPIDGLYLLPRGADDPDPSGLLGRSALRDILGTLGDRFDRVLIDTPPAAVADTSIMASQVDATLVVLRYGKSTQAGTLRAIELLQRANANIIGSVTNSLSQRVRDQSYLNYGHYAPQVKSERLSVLPAEQAELNNKGSALTELSEEPEL